MTEPFNEAATCDGSRLKSTIPRDFPDAASCAVKPAKFAGFYECANFWGGFCPHALLLGRDSYCNHPASREIYSRTKAENTGFRT